MAIFRPGGVVGSVSGALGGEVYVQSRNGPVVRRRAVRCAPQSTYALAARGAPGRIAAAWNALTDVQRAAWRTAAAQLKFPNRLGVLRQLSGFQLYASFSMDIYGGSPPASLAPPGQALIYAPIFVSGYYLAGGPFVVTSRGYPWPTSTPAEFLYFQSGRAVTQSTGFNRFRRLGSITRRIGSANIFALATAAGFDLFAGERFALADAWQVGGGYLGQRVWCTGTVDAVPFVIDDFESQSLAAYSGDASSFSIQSAVVKTGTYALLCSFTNAGAATRTLISTTGLPVYPVAGHAFEIWVQLNGAGTERAIVIFGGSDANNCYRFIMRSNALAGLQKVVSTTSTNLAIGSITSYTQGNWYRLVTEWGSAGAFTVRVFDSGGTQRMVSTATDTTYSYGGIGYQGLNVAAGTCNAYFDAFQITGRAA